ncbi:MAG TPA: glycosyl hydrolase family 18 protein [Candidatus Paceibacterota bacterium]|nr:glycosyl hydrolase family 18 protein [Candidatus Paceibacterota bacterium]
MQKYFMKALVAALITGAVPFLASAATTAAAKAPFYYGAWVPYWTGQAGEQQIAINLDSLNEVSPFSYEIIDGGTIKDDLKISSGLWSGWFSAVRSAGVKVIPTIAWFDTNGIYNLLSVASTRQAEETAITQLATANNFDGIDIDFEAMSPATRPYYSLFIEGLSERLHADHKVLTCSVVPRTPPSSIYVTVPANLNYAESYPVLNQYCDEVRLEAYDQGTVDLKLDASKGGNGTLYAPVADPDWVTKVVQYALQYINPKKIMLGIPTYGYEYEVSWANGVTTYQEVRAWDFFGAMDRADSLGISPTRDNAGELSFTFASTTYIQEPPDLTSYVSSTEPAALMNPNPNATTTFFVSFPDATSELQKVALAKKYGLRGVMFFKMDGDIDPAIWNSLN